MMCTVQANQTMIEASETAPVAQTASTEIDTPSNSNQPARLLQNVRQQPSDFASAVSQMTEHSPKLAAAKAEVRSKQLQSDATKWLGGPNVILSASVNKYSLEL